MLPCPQSARRLVWRKMVLICATKPKLLSLNMSACYGGLALAAHGERSAAPCAHHAQIVDVLKRRQMHRLRQRACLQRHRRRCTSAPLPASASCASGTTAPRWPARWRPWPPRCRSACAARRQDCTLQCHAMHARRRASFHSLAALRPLQGAGTALVRRGRHPLRSGGTH